MQNFGVHRVLEPTYSIPVSAWKLDNCRNISENEMRIRIKRIKLEEASFQQICNECDFNEEKIKLKVLDIIKKRGKLHNPATDSGGILYGIVDEIGVQYGKNHQLAVNDEVIGITTLRALPIHLDEIKKI
ncbi:MAG: L-erythro-3,5-diaminohexanoate dehydrogenase, partial [Bacillota bacterium]